MYKLLDPINKAPNVHNTLEIRHTYGSLRNTSSIISITGKGQ